MFDLPASTFTGLLALSLVGLLIGVVVQMIDSPDYQPPILGTLISAMIGSVLGGIVAISLFGISSFELGVNSLLIAVGLSLLLGVIYNLVVHRLPSPKRYYIQSPARVFPQQVYHSQIKPQRQSRLAMDRLLEEVQFPISKADLMSRAERSKHNDRLINLVQRLPDRVFGDPKEIYRYF